MNFWADMSTLCRLIEILSEEMRLELQKNFCLALFCQEMFSVLWGTKLKFLAIFYWEIAIRWMFEQLLTRYQKKRFCDFLNLILLGFYKNLMFFFSFFLCSKIFSANLLIFFFWNNWSNFLIFFKNNQKLENLLN